MKKAEYHVAYSWEKKRAQQSGLGNITLSIDKMRITAAVIEEWKKYISNVLDGANIVIINWIKLNT